MLTEEQEVEYRMYYMDILWEGDGEEPTEYDMIDDDILDAQSFKEAVDAFIQQLENW